MLAVQSGDAELSHVLSLADAEPPWAPALVVDAIAGLFQSKADFANGGADQFVWNHGTAIAREIGTTWRTVGAVENGELLVELAEALERFETEGGRESAEPVQAFLTYRKRVSGPFFGRPEPGDELAEALVEWALEHPDAFADPSGVPCRMGLAISVGLLADLNVHDSEGADWQRGMLAQINAVLVRNELPEHHEPERFAKKPHQNACTSFPYSFLHYLRRAFAHVCEDLPVPDDEKLRPEHETVIDDAGSMLVSHLLCHSDAEGFYVPIDFEDPIFDDEAPAHMLGSSQGLLRELIEVAPHIDIELVDDRPTPACEAELRAIEDGGPLWRERLVWYTLFEAATLSIELRTAIAFH